MKSCEIGCRFCETVWKSQKAVTAVSNFPQTLQKPWKAMGAAATFHRIWKSHRKLWKQEHTWSNFCGSYKSIIKLAVKLKSFTKALKEYFLTFSTLNNQHFLRCRFFMLLLKTGFPDANVSQNGSRNLQIYFEWPPNRALSSICPCLGINWTFPTTLDSPCHGLKHSGLSVGQESKHSVCTFQEKSSTYHILRYKTSRPSTRSDWMTAMAPASRRSITFISLISSIVPYHTILP